MATNQTQQDQQNSRSASTEEHGIGHVIISEKQNDKIQKEGEPEDDDEWLDWETKQDHIPMWKHMIAGSCAGIMEHVGMFPVDTVKTHIQASGRDLKFAKTARILYREEGLARFWKGAPMMASGCVPAHASYFLAYEKLKIYFGVDNQQFSIKQTAFIGSFTTFAHDFFIAPSDVVKQRLQLCKYKTTQEVINDILKTEGVRGLYRSYPLTVGMNIPFASIVIVTNENLKTLIQPWKKDYSHLWYFFCAGIAGGLAGLVTNPLDVIKTRLQTQEVRPSCAHLYSMWESDLQTQQQSKGSAQSQCVGKTPPLPDIDPVKMKANCDFQIKQSRYSDILSTYKYIMETEGIGAFKKGVLPRMSINVPSTALSWGTYELIKSFLIGDGRD